MGARQFQRMADALDRRVVFGAQTGDLEMVQRAHAEGGDLNAAGGRPLKYAFVHGNRAMQEWLARNGADLGLMFNGHGPSALVCDHCSQTLSAEEMTREVNRVYGAITRNVSGPASTLRQMRR
ncbi:MAG: hypothetical protein KGH72_03885 [Candidatus Micrarchaeota archaeon]|nr:hypothetical protein [Candidatus Micrarchaeota archaeon]